MNQILEKEFNWEIPNGMKVNKKVKAPLGARVYSWEPYAQELSDLYFNTSSGYGKQFSKDLVNGETYEAKIISLSENEALAQTETGQTIYIDMKKERKEAFRKMNTDSLKFHIGESINARVKSVVGTYYGSVVDSYMQTIRQELFDQIKSETSAYPVRIESINRGGYIVDLQGIKCFLPGSLAAANKITDFESYLGKEIPVMIEGYVEAKEMFVVSYKKYLKRIIEQKVKELDMTKKYEGTVTGSSEFGVFVEWDEIYTGLIYKTEFEENQIPNNFNSGDRIEFYIKEIKDNNRLTLALNKPTEKNTIVSEIDSKIKEGIRVTTEARIKHKRKNGILVELPSYNLMALIPQERANKRVRNLKQGESLEVNIFSVDTTSGKIFAEVDGE
jgi:small subunit ribosomal protein S1